MARRKKTTSVTSCMLLALLLGFVGEHAPFRLMALVAEAMWIIPGPIVGTKINPKGNDRYWDAVDMIGKLQDRFGFNVKFVPDLEEDEGALGMTVIGPNHRDILVDEALHWNDRFVTLAHEGAHNLQPYQLSKNQREAFAESVACLVARDGLREHARYLANFKADTLVVDLVYWREIYQAAETLER